MAREVLLYSDTLEVLAEALSEKGMGDEFLEGVSAGLQIAVGILDALAAGHSEFETATVAADAALAARILARRYVKSDN